MNLENLKFVPNAKITQSSTLSSFYYKDQSVFNFELKHLFPSTWQMLGPKTWWKEKGDARTFNFAGEPLIVVNDGKRIVCFFNVCRHRAGPLLRGCSKIKQFQCHYHGWVYDLAGNLKSTPEMGNIDNFDAKEYGLKQIEIKVWQGMVFAKLNRKGLSFDDLFGGIEAPSGSDWGKWQFHKRVTYDIKCNWKIYVDNYLEGYHVPYVHPKLNKILDYKSYVTECSDWGCLQWSPIKKGKGPYRSADNDPEVALYYFVYPNFMINLLPDRLQTNVVIPIDTNRCQVVFDFYYPSHTTESLKHEDAVFSDEVQLEDVTICEELQINMQSKSYCQGRYSALRETGLFQFHQSWKKQVSQIRKES